MFVRSDTLDVVTDLTFASASFIQKVGLGIGSTVSGAVTEPRGVAS